MRLWHIDLIPYLPNSQLVAQWRELNSIYKKQDKHILINYIYNYPKDYLYHYSNKVLTEMVNRGISIKSWDNYRDYFLNFLMSGVYTYEDDEPMKYPEHNLNYLIICYYNLYEKYTRGQKDFTNEIWIKIFKFCNPIFLNQSQISIDHNEANLSKRRINEDLGILGE